VPRFVLRVARGPCWALLSARGLVARARYVMVRQARSRYSGPSSSDHTGRRLAARSPLTSRDGTRGPKSFRCSVFLHSKYIGICGARPSTDENSTAASPCTATTLVSTALSSGPQSRSRHAVHNALTNAHHAVASSPSSCPSGKPGSGLHNRNAPHLTEHVPVQHTRRTRTTGGSPARPAESSC